MRRYATTFTIMVLALICAVGLSVCLGSSYVNLNEVFNTIKNQDANDTMYQVIWNIRMPRIVAAIFLGGALAVSGFLLQTFFGNPIAGPYVLGISSGAKLFVALTMIILLENGLVIGSFGMVAAAFAGSMLSMLIVLLLSGRVNNMSMLVVCGIMIGYICSAITDFVVTFADDSNIVNLHNWSLGSLSGMNWSKVGILAPIIGCSVILIFALCKPIGAYQLGESYAKNSGVNISMLRCFLIIMSSVLSACVTAFAGPISFVGIAVPHLVKLCMKTAKPIVLIPGCFLGGAIITLMCDSLARYVCAPTELSISSVTAVLLAPIVIWIMVNHRRSRHE